MRILHVGWGFSPWRPGGLITYAEDLMGMQAERGHEVAYFLSGRWYPYISGPRLKHWRRGRVQMHEVVNPPVLAAMESGTRDPDRDLSEPRMEAAFGRVVRAMKPDIVHVQELHGLPSSLLDVAHDAGVPTLMTLQDYGPLCATLRLYDADGRVCLRHDVGADCVARNAAAPAGPAHLIGQTIQFEIDRLRRILGIGPEISFARVAPLVRPLVRRVTGGGAQPATSPNGAEPALADAFQRRRDVNVERLGRVDRLIAQSARVAEIYERLGVPGDRMSTLPFTLRHIARLRPREVRSPATQLTFGTLNGCASPSKGSELVIDALRRLRQTGHEGRFRLLVFGYVDDAVRAELAAFPGVELRGLYGRAELDALLDDVDVGLMPSIWEEAFGYTGTEMLAKGIPLVANPLGGIVEYAIEGETAWLNDSCSGEGLAVIMATLIDEPHRVHDMHRRVLAARDRLVLPMERHLDALDAVYAELANARQSTSVR